MSIRWIIEVRQAIDEPESQVFDYRLIKYEWLVLMVISPGRASVVLGRERLVK